MGNGPFSVVLSNGTGAYSSGCANQAYWSDLLVTTPSAARPIPCFLRGTRIRTKRGDIPVEALELGDKVVVPGGAVRPILWRGHRDIDCHHHPRPSDVWPVRISAGACGFDTPRRDLSSRSIIPYSSTACSSPFATSSPAPPSRKSHASVSPTFVSNSRTTIFCSPRGWRRRAISIPAIARPSPIAAPPSRETARKNGAGQMDPPSLRWHDGSGSAASFAPIDLDVALPVIGETKSRRDRDDFHVNFCQSPRSSWRAPATLPHHRLLTIDFDAHHRGGAVSAILCVRWRAAWLQVREGWHAHPGRAPRDTRHQEVETK